MSSSKPADPAFAAALDRILAERFPSADSAARQKLLDHYRLLVDWNRRLNLTRVIAPAEAARKHFGESLFLAAHLPEDTKTVVDVGSGAGFPGLALAAVRPAVHVTCVESVGKKATFLREVSRGWTNVRVLDQRIEDVSGEFDWATARAVAIEPLLPKLAEIAENIAFLGAEDAAGAFTKASNWRLTACEPLPWKGSGALFLAEVR